MLKPQIAAGDTARSFELGGLGLPGGVDKTTANNAFTTSPGYDFRLNQGVQARDQGAANAGTLNSGAQAKALTQFGQDYGSNEYGNYFSRLQALAGGGAAATGQATQLGQNYGDNSSNITLGQGQQRASAYNAIGNNISGTAGGLANLYASTYRQPQQPVQPSYAAQG